jgi:hypothetical protein
MHAVRLKTLITQWMMPTIPCYGKLTERSLEGRVEYLEFDSESQEGVAIVPASVAGQGRELLRPQRRTAQPQAAPQVARLSAGLVSHSPGTRCRHAVLSRDSLLSLVYVLLSDEGLHCSLSSLEHVLLAGCRQYFALQ